MTRNAGKRESRALPRLAGLGAPLYIISGHLLIHTHPPAHAPTVGKQPMGGAPDTVILLSMKRSMRVCACSREHPRGRRQPPSSRHPREPGPPASCPVAGPRTGRRRAIVPRPRVCPAPRGVGRPGNRLLVAQRGRWLPVGRLDFNYALPRPEGRHVVVPVHGSSRFVMAMRRDSLIRSRRCLADTIVVRSVSSCAARIAGRRWAVRTLCSCPPPRQHSPPPASPNASGALATS